VQLSRWTFHSSCSCFFPLLLVVAVVIVVAPPAASCFVAVFEIYGAVVASAGALPPPTSSHELCAFYFQLLATLSVKLFYACTCVWGAPRRGSEREGAIGEKRGRVGSSDMPFNYESWFQGRAREMARAWKRVPVECVSTGIILSRF